MMQKGSLSGQNPFIQLLLIFAIVLISMMVVTLIGVLLAVPFVGFDRIISIATTGGDIAILKYFQVVQSIGLFVVPALFAARLFAVNPLNWLHFKRSHLLLVMLSMVMFIAVQPVSAYSAMLNSSINLPEFLQWLETWMHSAEDAATSLVFKFLDTKSAGVILFNIFMVAVIPAFGEEMLFRGAIQPTIGRIVKNEHAAVWLTAFLFSAIHMQFLTFIPRLILGAILGYLLVYGKSLWYPIVGHFVNNFVALVVFYYFRFTKPDVNPFDVNEQVPSPWIAALAIVAIVGLFVVFRKLSNKKGLINQPLQ